jgi:hypothetical protein
MVGWVRGSSVEFGTGVSPGFEPPNRERPGSSWSQRSSTRPRLGSSTRPSAGLARTARSGAAAGRGSSAIGQDPSLALAAQQSAPDLRQGSHDFTHHRLPGAAAGQRTFETNPSERASPVRGAAGHRLHAKMPAESRHRLGAFRQAGHQRAASPVAEFRLRHWRTDGVNDGINR